MGFATVKYCNHNEITQQPEGLSAPVLLSYFDYYCCTWETNIYLQTICHTPYHWFVCVYTFQSTAGAKVSKSNTSGEQVSTLRRNAHGLACGFHLHEVLKSPRSSLLRSEYVCLKTTKYSKPYIHKKIHHMIG